MGKMKKKGPAKPSKPKMQLNTQSRKSQRKDARKLKKQNKAQFFQKKFGPKQVKNLIPLACQTQPNHDFYEQVPEDQDGTDVKEKVIDDKVKKQLELENQRQRKEKKLQKERTKQRKKQLRAENARLVPFQISLFSVHGLGYQIEMGLKLQGGKRDQTLGEEPEHQEEEGQGGQGDGAQSIRRRRPQ